MTANRHGVSFRGDENALEWGSGEWLYTFRNVLNPLS